MSCHLLGSESPGCAGTATSAAYSVFPAAFPDGSVHLHHSRICLSGLSVIFWPKAAFKEALPAW